ncbi:MAG TPA: nitrous oxide reductase accessory protein NosL [bacterium]|nr:nitrous oxide reductase accessory protein NosL [bacterium]
MSGVWKSKVDMEGIMGMFNKKVFLSVLILISLSLSVSLAGCSSNKAKLPLPRKVFSSTTSQLCGMFLKQYPGPEAQIVYKNGRTYFFCDTVELFQWLHLKGIADRGTPLVMYVQDMTNNSWKHPEGHFVDAKKAYYVVGSKRTGCMGVTFASFLSKKAADKFITKYGGKIYKFDEITVKMIDKAANSANMKIMKMKKAKLKNLG